MSDANNPCPPRTRKWIIGLLIYGLLVNLHILFRAAVSLYQPASLTLNVQENAVEIYRDRDGTPVAMSARYPPNAYWSDAHGFPAAAYYALLSLTAIALALTLYLRCGPPSEPAGKPAATD